MVDDDRTTDRLVVYIIGTILTVAIGGLVAKVVSLDGDVATLKVDVAVTRNEVGHANDALQRIENLLAEEHPIVPKRLP